MPDQPTLRVLSLGAGVQSTTLLLLAAEGRIPKLDAAIFSDTQWEPAAVYAHLDRIDREVAQPAGIPIYRVATGNIRKDALDPAHRFASMPLFVKNQDGGDGMTRRQCSQEYKIKPIKRQVRELLGYPHPAPVPKGVHVEQWIGISRDEIGRAKGSDVKYARNAFPLLDMPGGGRRPRGLDARRLPALPEGFRLGVNAEVRVHRLPVPRQRPVAPTAGHLPVRPQSRRPLARGLRRVAAPRPPLQRRSARCGCNHLRLPGVPRPGVGRRRRLRRRDPLR